MEEKLERFIRLALTEAASKRDEMIEEIESYKKEKLSEAEDKCLEKSYKTVQSGVAAAKREHDKIIAMEPVESKKKLLAYREKLIDDLFGELYKKIDEFKNSGAYEAFLTEKAQSAVSEVAGGEVTVLIDKSDEKFLPSLKEKLGCEVKLSDGILGGAVAENIGAKKICNNSLSERLAYLRENFLKDSKFSIY